MSIESLLNDGVTTDLLVKVLCYTVFYSALAWLPLRAGAAVAGRIRHRHERRRREAIRPRTRPIQPEWVLR